MIQMTEMQQKILQLKKEKDFCILAHTYESHDILEIADFTGDSFALSRKATGVSQKNVLMCGVRFMAETVKLLSPEKRVVIASADAGCPMAEQFTRADVEAWRREHPHALVVAYVNTTTDIKRACDYCVTSASAVNIVSKLPDDKEILFIPDKNLGSYVAKKLPSKKLVFWNGGCPVHNAITPEELYAAKALHPDALVLTHPECEEEVRALSDYLGSTQEIIAYAQRSEEEEFIICTEDGVEFALNGIGGGKRFYFPAPRPRCMDMKLSTPEGVLRALKTLDNPITVTEQERQAALRPLEKMLEMCQ